MTGQEFINLLFSKIDDCDTSDKMKALMVSEDLTFEELKIEDFEEYKDFVKAPMVLYYLIKRDKFLKKQSIRAISSYVSMLQIKSDNTDWRPSKDERIGFELLGTSKKVLGAGKLSPVLEPQSYTNVISYKKIIEFLKLHPGYVVDLDSSFDTEDFTENEIKAIKELEKI